MWKCLDNQIIQTFLGTASYVHFIKEHKMSLFQPFPALHLSEPLWCKSEVWTQNDTFPVSLVFIPAPFSTVLDKLIVAGLVKKCLTLYGTKRFVTKVCEPVIGPYPDSRESTPHLTPYSLKFHFNIILSPMFRSLSNLFLWGFPSKILFFLACYMPRQSHPAGLVTLKIFIEYGSTNYEVPF